MAIVVGCATSTAATSLETFSSTVCNSTCPGADNYSCCGIWAMDLYRATATMKCSTTGSGALSPQTVDGYSYLGCYTDGTDPINSGASIFPALNSPEWSCEWCANVDTDYQICGFENKS
jgi:hypothetical protein